MTIRDIIKNIGSYVDGCSSCGWTSEEGGVVAGEDKCPECGDEGTMLGCRDYDLDYDVNSAAYRYDAFNEGVEWATAQNWFLLILKRIHERIRLVL